MYKKPTRPPLKNVIKRIFVAIGIALAAVIVVAAVYFGVRYFMNRPKPVPTPASEMTSPPGNSEIAQPPTAPNCYKWDLVSRENIGQILCVYGTVTKIYSTPEATTRMKFSEDPNTFFVYSANYYFYDASTGKDIKAGDCIFVTGQVALIGGVLNMDIGQGKTLYFCEDWMK